MHLLFSLVLYRHSFQSIAPLLYSIGRLRDSCCKHSVYLNVYNACPLDSDDPTPSRVRSVLGSTLLAYEYADNIGFGAANNKNFLSSDFKEDFLFIVANPDTSFDPSSLLPLLDWVVDNPQVSCAAPLVINPGGDIQFSAKHDPTLVSLLLGRFHWLKCLSILDRYDAWHRNLDTDYTRNVIQSSYLSGCFLVIPSVYYYKVNGFSEKYFLHLEDADIVRKLSLHGSCLHNPVGSVVHEWARGSHRSPAQAFHLIYSFILYVRFWGFRVF